MSVTPDSIFKLLSDLSASADKIIEEDCAEIMGPRVSEWMTKVENKADAIYEGSESDGDLPSLMKFLRGTPVRKVPRISAILNEMHRLHVHEAKMESTKARKSSVVKKGIKKGNYESHFVHSKENETPKLKIVFNQNAGTSTEMETPLSTVTPANDEGTALKDSKGRKASKRKSESELSPENIKKIKSQVNDKCDGDNELGSDPRRMEKSIKNPRVEKLKAKNSSLLLPNYANIKSSVGATILKENRSMRSKFQTKQDKAVENRKIEMALRQQKLEESKRTGLEKEKQKLGKLRSGAPTTLKGAMQKQVAEKNETIKEISKKNPLKGKMVEKTKDKTPGAKKNQKNAPAEKMLNLTYVTAEESSTSKKGNFKTQAKPQTKKHLIEQNPASTTPVGKKKGPESYAMTPVHSSFVSYDISEIRSDSEEEEQETNSKPVPSWATGVRLRNALLQQHHDPIDTDELFGNIVEIPDLALIMGVTKKQYTKRTSSAVWNVSFSALI